MVRVGLIGFGLAGQAFHAPMIRGVKGMELACVLERHTDNAKQRYPEVRRARNLDELLSDKSINLVVVATPNDSHYSYAKTILEAGRHVVVDKPLTPTMKEAEELVRLAAQRKKLLSVYQDRRWDGAFITVKKLVQSGLLGTVVEYQARFDRFRLGAKANACGNKPTSLPPGSFGISAHTSSMAHWSCSANRNRFGHPPFASARTPQSMTLSMSSWNTRAPASYSKPASSPTSPAITCSCTEPQDPS